MDLDKVVYNAITQPKATTDALAALADSELIDAHLLLARIKYLEILCLQGMQTMGVLTNPGEGQVIADTLQLKLLEKLKQVNKVDQESIRFIFNESVEQALYKKETSANNYSFTDQILNSCESLNI